MKGITHDARISPASYTRGNDLGGSLEGAGGIGGLLGRSHGYSSGNWTNHNCYHSDGNGNITYLLNGSQTLAASYRYDPFGNTISSSGSLASANVYRFSSKEFHANSGLYYYGYRWYHPNLQRWLIRDPIQEWGGINLYGFVLNRPTHSLDPFGEQGTNDPNPKPFPLLSIPPGMPPITTPPKFEMQAPFPTPWPSHHASLDAGPRAGNMCANGPAARPAKPTRPCTIPFATTPKKPAGTEKKYCEGHGMITVSCTEHDSCEFHSQPLNAPTQYHWVTKRECPCPPPPDPPKSPTPDPKPE